jgi:hypothetical protein
MIRLVGNLRLYPYNPQGCVLISKPKMVALGAVMHKVCNIVFAILRDEKEFEIITPEEHQKNYLKARCDIAL